MSERMRRPGRRPTAALIAAVSLASMLAGISGAAEDPALDAARTALAAGQPVEALAVLRGVKPRGPSARLIEARAQLALGRTREAIELLGSIDGAGIPDAVARWDAGSRGEASQVGAEALLAAGGNMPSALHLLAQALELGGRGVEPDRCLALDCQCLLRSGERDQAVRAARRLWQGWPRSAYRVKGGLVLAHAIATSEPTAAREILAAIRVDAAISASDRRDAGELLCRILLVEHPGQCLVVAEQELGHLAATERGALPLYRALALARLEPRTGAQALRTLPADLAADPTVQPALRDAEANGAASVAMVCERARASIALGRADEARALLEPLAADQPEALAALCSVPGLDCQRFVGFPAARSPIAALALTRALAGAGKLPAAWAVLLPLLPASAAPSAREAASDEADGATAEVLYWASVCAPEQERREGYRRRLLASKATGLEAGLAWCAEAEARTRDGGDAVEAWSRAAALLPAEHPWQAEAAWRAARELAARGDDPGARALLDGPASWRADDEVNCRCRFLLAQVLARSGARDEAMRAADSLTGRGDAARQARVEAFLASLRDTP